MFVNFNFEKEFNTILFSRLNQKMGQHCFKLFLQNFKKEGYLNGNGHFLMWKPLSPKYKAMKDGEKGYTRKGVRYNYPMGVFTGELKKSFVINYRNNGFSIRNTSEHAEHFHKERPILYQDESIDNEMIKFIHKEVSGMFKDIQKKLNP